MQIKKINRIFDFKGPHGFIPNGWNHNFYNDLWNNSYEHNSEFIDDFNKKYLQISVYDCTLNLPSHFLNDVHISTIHYDENENVVNDKNDLYIYSISPYGNVNISIGTDFSWHQNLHTFDFISDNVKTLLNARNFYILFDYSSEGDIKENIFENLHLACKRNNIPEDKVIFISAASNTTQVYNLFLQKNPQDLKFKSACYNWPILAKSRELNGILSGDGILEFNGHKNLNTLVKKNNVLNFTCFI